jgi:signal transduction histidine kinase
MLRLRTRILLAFVVALLPVAVGVGLWASQAAEQALDEELSQRLTDVAGVLAAQITDSPAAGRLSRLEPDSTASIARFRDGLVVARGAASLRRIRIVDVQSRTLVDTERDSEPFRPAFDLGGDATDVQRALESGSPQASVRFEAEDGRLIKRGIAVISQEGQAIALVVVDGSAEYFGRLIEARRALAIAGVGSFLLIVLVTSIVSRRITAPLSSLSRAARRIGGGDLHTPIEVRENDEIGDLANALRNMQRSLASREEEAQMMLAGIAHEIRNPLGGMELFVGLLEESVEPESDAEEYAGRVRRELGYLSRVVEEFLAYARDRPLELSRCTMRFVVDEVFESVSAAAEQRGVHLVAESDAGELSGDLEALRGVLHNLALNAVQACEAGGTVTLQAVADGRERVLRVLDDGHGMPESVRTEVFRPFYTTREKGTGLGLALAKRIVERHGGALTLTSEVGVGTAVAARVPFNADAPHVTKLVKTPGGLRVDDDFDGDMIG